MSTTTTAALAFHKDFEGFMDFLQDRELGAAALSPKRFIEVLGIDLQTLANQAHVHRIRSFTHLRLKASSASCARSCK